MLEEQKKFIELIDVDTTYLGIHGINTVAFDAHLPEERDVALARVGKAIANLDENYLNGIPERHSV